MAQRSRKTLDSQKCLGECSAKRAPLDSHERWKSDLKKARRIVYFLPMFIIDLHYIVPLEQLDAHMAEHVKYLNKYYKQNTFVASGRKVPRTGGIILALTKSREELDGIIQEDPFYIHNLAEFKVTEFMTSQSHPEIKKLLKGL